MIDACLGFWLLIWFRVCITTVVSSMFFNVCLFMNDTHRRLVCNRLIVQYVIDSCGVVRLFMLKVMMQSLLAVLAHIVAYMVIIFAAAECQIRS